MIVNKGGQLVNKRGRTFGARTAPGASHEAILRAIGAHGGIGAEKPLRKATRNIYSQLECGLEIHQGEHVGHGVSGNEGVKDGVCERLREQADFGGEFNHLDPLTNRRLA
jgi:hypothetical protein